MSKCKVCGFRLADGMKKCPMCGAMPGSTKAGELLNTTHLPKYLCPSCKAEIIGEHRYCPACMKELSEAVKTVGIKEQGYNDCVQCGVSLPVGAKFCHECGAKQENNCPHCGATIMPNAKNSVTIAVQNKTRCKIQSLRRTMQQMFLVEML